MLNGLRNSFDLIEL